ncbi:MAG: DUF4405 domain-containing protein [Desulfobacteraceae bacterium]|jgi:hypothetical protein
MESSKNTLRKITSLTLFLSGIVLFINSLVICLGPPTHVAHFSGWLTMGLTKCQWNAMHLMSGILFIIAMIFHVYFNWKPMVSYMKNKKNKTLFSTRAFIISFLLTAYVCTGAVLELPPMGQFINWLRSVKSAHVRNYGTPPYGGAEKAPLKFIAGYMGWEPAKCIEALRKKGFIVQSPDQSIRSIGESNNLSTGAVLDNMRY